MPSLLLFSFPHPFNQGYKKKKAYNTKPIVSRASVKARFSTVEVVFAHCVQAEREALLNPSSQFYTSKILYLKTIANEKTAFKK